MLLLVVMNKEASFAVILTTADSQLKMGDIEGFCDNAPAPAKKQSKREATEKKP